MSINWVYILANKRRGRFYTGSISDPVARHAEQMSEYGSKHVANYNLHTLVYFKAYEDKETALAVEHRIKRKSRDYKMWLIEGINPDWADISQAWFDEAARER